LAILWFNIAMDDDLFWQKFKQLRAEVGCQQHGAIHFGCHKCGVSVAFTYIIQDAVTENWGYPEVGQGTPLGEQ
jgi:hypothetical protein